MSKTEHRPVPLPDRNTAPPSAQPATNAGSPPAGAPQPVPGDSKLPQGATHWSKAYYDPQGQRHTARRSVPVNKNGVVVAEVYECPRCRGAQWFPPGMKLPPLCNVDGRTMRPWRPGRMPALPWREMWRVSEPRLRAVWAGGVVAVAGVALDAASVPAPALGVVAIPAGWAAKQATERAMVHRAQKRGRLDKGDHEGGRRLRETIARRARSVGYCTTAGLAWLTAADVLGLDPHTFGGDLSWTLLPALWAYPAFTWWRRLRGQRTGTDRPRGSVGQPPGGDLATVDPFQVQVVTTWAVRVGAANGVLPNTRLAGFMYVKGGWSATVVSDTPGSIEPDRWRAAAGRVAAAYRCGVQDVALELDGGDASQATVRVQKENPLCEVARWPGPTVTWDFQRGTSWVGRFGDDERALYRWWNEGGPWHDLIAGATGSGKSEFVNSLLLLGLNSEGLVLDRVIDPQWGQSFGDLQDHVDWFAPDISEARLLLLDTVKQMRRRNRLYSRKRQKTWLPTRDEPLIVVTIDEAHEVLKDPICLALVEKLAKMARKCGIKLRVITPIPTVTEIGNSTPIKDALLGGNLIVFRTGSPVSTNVSIGPVLPVDPHRLPSEWPKGSPGAGKTTAGLGFMAGASRREVPWRSFYVGDDMRPWLYDADGALSITPGVAGAAMMAESGVLWGHRRDRIQAMFDSPPDDGDILPEGLVEVLMAMAGGQSTAALQRILAESTPKGDAAGDDGTARTAVLMAAVRHADDAGRVEKATLTEHARSRDGEALKSRTLTDALTKLVGDGTLVRIRNGVYELTDRARNEVSREANALVAALVGPEPVDEAPVEGEEP